MEALIAQVGGSAGGVASIFMLGKLLAWYYKRKVSGLVLLKGKTTICNELGSEKLLFLDLDMFLEKMPNYEDALKSKSDMVLLHTALKEQIEKLMRVYQKPVVLVSRSYELLRIIGLKRKRIHFVCASKEAHRKAELMYKDAQQFASDEAQRLRLMNEIRPDNVKVFDNLADIKKIVAQVYNVKETRL